MYRYVFRDNATGARLTQSAESINRALALLGRTKEETTQLECWDGETRLWHYVDGEIREG